MMYSITIFMFYSQILMGSDFSVPSYLSIGGLPQAVERYAEKVETCLHKEDMTLSDQRWINSRRKNWTCVERVNRNKKRPSSLKEILSRRTSACSVIINKFVHKKVDGMQYGNCGEGMAVNLCMAHQAGQVELMQCDSTHDHTFGIFLKKGQDGQRDTICLMDRWPLGPKRTNQEYYFCHVSIMNGSVHYKGRKLEGRDWYESVSCQSWQNPQMFSGKRARNVTSQIWKEKYSLTKEL